MNGSRRWRAMATTTMVFVMMTLLVASSATSDGPLYSDSERVGFAFVTKVYMSDTEYVYQALSDYPTKRLGAGWYSDWQYTADPVMPQDQTIEYAQLIRVMDSKWPPDWTAIDAAVQANPGALWLIGNEPECRNQDNLTSEVYAERYHELYTHIKALDSTAQIANGGIVEPTPLRLLWLDKVMAHYEATYGQPMPVDVWNIHMQILREWDQEASCADPEDCAVGAGIPQGMDPVADGTADLVYRPMRDDGGEMVDDYTVMVDPDVFAGMVTDFRQWMKANGQQDKPLIISEMGVLYPSTYVVAEGDTTEEKQKLGDRAIEAFMRDTFAWMSTATDADMGMAADEDRLVQRWLWFSLNDSFFTWDNQNGFNGSLYDNATSPPELTRFGRTFVSIQSGPWTVALPMLCK